MKYKKGDKFVGGIEIREIIITHIGDASPYLLNGRQWVSEEFLNILQLCEESKPTIKPCLYCKGKCHVETFDRHDIQTYHVICNDEENCGYRASIEDSESEAIEIHNELYQSLGGIK